MLMHITMVKKRLADGSECRKCEDVSALLRSRGVLETGADGRLTYELPVLEAIASDAQLVLHEQIRNSILQVVHR